jgi:methylenetetrahydrofolate reductase (NADPH)
MPTEKSLLKDRIESGKPLLIAEISPPQSGDPELVRAVARRYVGKVHALGVSDNRDGACMSALAAASLLVQEGIEPILHMVTRDRNRIALVSDYLGAQALGIRNVLCTTGTHQTLGPARAAKNVFDIDSIQLIRTLANLSNDGAIVGEASLNGAAPICLGAVANPYADPVEMQVLRLAKKVSAGAQFLISQPIFDLERFRAFWDKAAQRGIAEKAAVLLGVRVLTDAASARNYAARRPSPMIPEALLARLSSKTDTSAQRAVGIDIATETIQQLSGLKGVRGFEIRADGDDEAALEVMQRSGLGVN